MNTELTREKLILTIREMLFIKPNIIEAYNITKKVLGVGEVSLEKIDDKKVSKIFFILKEY